MSRQWHSRAIMFALGQTRTFPAIRLTSDLVGKQPRATGRRLPVRWLQVDLTSYFRFPSKSRHSNRRHPWSRDRSGLASSVSLQILTRGVFGRNDAPPRARLVQQPKQVGIGAVVVDRGELLARRIEETEADCLMPDAAALALDDLGAG